MHLTETCDTDAPHLVVNVHTAPAPQHDERGTLPVHQSLAARGLLPASQFVDSDYVDYARFIFAKADCADRPTRARCTRSERRGKILNLRPQAQFEALRAAREFMDTEAGRREYQIRSGIEGAISQAVRAFPPRRSRYRGQAKTQLQQLATGAAINLVRVDDWLRGKPRGETRVSRFAALHRAAQHYYLRAVCVKTAPH